METFLGIVFLLILGGIVTFFIVAPGIALTIVIVVITVIIAKKVVRRKREKRIEVERREQWLRAQREEQALKEQKLFEQRNLLNTYKNSNQLILMLNSLCGTGNGRKLPDTIRIDNEGVTATCDGVSTSYSFIHHRLPKLPYADGSGTDTFEEYVQYIVRPQVAMAEAINSLLSYEYDICDKAKRWHNEFDGKVTFFYASDYVIMTLKPKYSF